jgi:hypothetical protein
MFFKDDFLVQVDDDVVFGEHNYTIFYSAIIIRLYYESNRVISGTIPKYTFLTQQ